MTGQHLIWVCRVKCIHSLAAVICGYTDEFGSFLF
jgi:hypothetical protein